MWKIMTWNVNGLRACGKKGFLDWLAREQPDVLCLQETRAFPEQVEPALREPPGYAMTWNPARRRGYSGTAVLTRRQPKNIVMGLGNDAYDEEGRLIEMKFEDFSLFNVYFPNGGRDQSRVPFKLEFYGALLKKVEAYHRKKFGVMITGDWNVCHRPIDLARPKANETNTGFLPEERACIDRYLEAGLVDTFRQRYPDKKDAYTWWSQRGGAREKNIGWRLDYFLVSDFMVERARDTVIHAEVEGSDHCPVELQWA